MNASKSDNARVLSGEPGSAHETLRAVLRALAGASGYHHEALVEWCSTDVPGAPAELPPLYYAALRPGDSGADMPLGLGDTPAAALTDLLWTLGGSTLLAVLRTHDRPTDEPSAQGQESLLTDVEARDASHLPAAGAAPEGESMRYIALLRGINVGGHMVKMERLRNLFAELGFANVRTYIQSGNVFFESTSTDREALTLTIERHLQQALGYPVPVFLRTVAELERIVASDAFQHLSVTPDMRLCVVFTAEPIPATLTVPLRTPKNDMEIVRAADREAYVVWYLINGRPPASQGVKVLGDRTTTRFFHTLAKLLQAAQSG